MKIKAVIFDLFGTLVNNFGFSAEQMGRELATSLGAPYEPFIALWNQTLPMRIIGDFDTVEANVEYVCQGIGLRPEAEKIRQAVDIRMNYVREALKPRPDAIETPNRLKDRGYTTGLISNCSPEIPNLWEETPFAHVIDTPVFSCRAHLRKPDPRIYHLACEQLGAAPGACLYIADGEDHELAAAAGVGLCPVLIRASAQQAAGGSHQEAREWQGTTISALAEVLGLVGTKNSPS
jgi:putative hydrolase of the HAD superfamily